MTPQRDSCGFVDRRLGHDNNTIHEITRNITKKLFAFGNARKWSPWFIAANSAALVERAGRRHADRSRGAKRSAATGGAGAGIGRGVKTFKDPKDLLLVLRFDTDSVVLY